VSEQKVRAFHVGDRVVYWRRLQGGGDAGDIYLQNAVIELIYLDGTARLRIWRTRHRVTKRLAELIR
jgi:hypothetical protein